MSQFTFAVIFDNDGVLVDTETFSEQAYQTALQEQGIEINPADGERYCGLTDADILRDMQQRYQRALDFDLFSARKRELYFKHAAEGTIQVFPGARELITELRTAGIPLALASSAPREKIEFNLKQSRLEGIFPHIVSGEDFERGKPDPEMFLAAAKHLAVPPSRCIVIEDSINGLKAARAAGMAGIGVANTFPAEKLRPHATLVVTSLTHLSPNRLQQLLAHPGTI